MCSLSTRLMVDFLLLQDKDMVVTELSSKRKGKRIQQQNTFPCCCNRNCFPVPLPSILGIKAVPGTYLTFDRRWFRGQKTIFKIIKKIFHLVKNVFRPSLRTSLAQRLLMKGWLLSELSELHSKSVWGISNSLSRHHDTVYLKNNTDSFLQIQNYLFLCWKSLGGPCYQRCPLFHLGICCCFTHPSCIFSDVWAPSFPGLQMPCCKARHTMEDIEGTYRE